MSAVLTDAGVELEVSLGVGRQANVGVWDAARWDANVWGQPSTALGDWVDITCDVEVPFTLHAGSDQTSGVVTQWAAATTALTVHGEQYNPRIGAPYGGLLGPGLALRIRYRAIGATAWLPAFAGYVNDDGFNWHPSHDARPGYAAIAATDATRILNSADLMARPVAGAGETAAQRVTRILDAVQWPADQRDISAGGVTVRGTDLAGSAWSQLLLLADTDLAHMWVDGAGVLRYRPQGRVRPQADPVAWIGCNLPPEDLPAYVPIAITGQQPTVIRNIANVQRSVIAPDPAGVVVTRTDDPSIARYRRHVYSRTDLIHTDDAYSVTLAQAILAGAAWPSAAPASVELTSKADPGIAALLLALEPDLTVMVEDLDGSLWTCQPAGWSVTIDRAAVAGTITLLDVTSFVGAQWDAAVWDQSRWSY